jgi:hypothetical protein
MAVGFLFAIHPSSVGVSLPETDFNRTFETVLFGEKSDIRSNIELMKQLTVLLHRETQKRIPFKYLLIKLFNQFDYSIESESEISKERLEQLACALSLHLRLRRLVINGKDLTIPLWRRNLENSIRLFFVEIIPLAVMFLSIYIMPAFFRSNPFLFLIFLFVVLYLCRFIGKGIWMLTLQRLVPRGYVQYLMQARNTRPGWFDRFWMRVFWGAVEEQGKA